MTFDPERLFREAVVDEPAPPPPPEPREDDGRGEGGPHTHVVMPLVIFQEDGAVATSDWRGTALVLAYNLAAFVVVWQALQALGARVGIAVTAEAIIGGVTTGILTAVWLLVLGVLCLLGWAIWRGWRRWRGRRAREAAA